MSWREICVERVYIIMYILEFLMHQSNCEVGIRISFVVLMLFRIYSFSKPEAFPIPSTGDCGKRFTPTPRRWLGFVLFYAKRFDWSFYRLSARDQSNRWCGVFKRMRVLLNIETFICMIAMIIITEPFIYDDYQPEL